LRLTLARRPASAGENAKIRHMCLDLAATGGAAMSPGRCSTPFPAVLASFAMIALSAGAPLAGADSPATPGSPIALEPPWHPTPLPHLAIARAAGEIRIDGDVSDPGWAGAARADGFAEHTPGDQTQPPVTTTVLVAYDDERLYAAFLCEDDPAAVRATMCERDQIWNDDNVGLCIDTYGDHGWAYEILVNPIGIQGDLLWSPAGGEDSSYDIVYQSVGRLTASGYQVEIAVPFSSLRFPNRDVQSWRIDFWRNRPRAVRAQFSWAAYTRDEQCWPCQWGTIDGIAGVQPGRGLLLLPSFIAHQSGERADDGAFRNGQTLGESSLGAKYAASSAFAAEGTVNPDFSQVESDAAQIDVNTTFALFYPEKRPFFQEGSDLFKTYFDVVYTRTINDPLYAAKVTGRPGRANYAFAERSAFVSNGKSTSNIARLRYNLGRQSHIGAVATDRRYDNGGAGTLAGLDGSVLLGRNYSFVWQVLVTRTVEPSDTTLTADPDDPSASRLNALLFDRGRHTAAYDGESYWGHAWVAAFERSARHWGFDVEYWERSPTFRADNGFEYRNDQRLGKLETSYTLYANHGLLDQVQSAVQVNRQWDFGGLRKDEWVLAQLHSRLRRAQTGILLQYLGSNELFHDIRFKGIREWSVTVASTPGRGLEYGGVVAWGHRIARDDLVMGRQLTWSAYANVRPINRLLLETSLDYIQSDDLTSGERLFDDTIARGKLSLQVSRELSTRVVVQYVDSDRVWELDPLVTYRLNPFSIFYAGSTRDYSQIAPEDGTASWRLSARQYFLKLQYLFQI
jgi:hypothetical protein